MARKQWRCFHCDEVFTDPRCAAEHFGEDLDSRPACRIAAYEGHLITYIRKLESQIASYALRVAQSKTESEAMRDLRWFMTYV